MPISHKYNNRLRYDDWRIRNSSIGASSLYRYKEKGILKPRSGSNKGLINKLTSFFDRYSLTNFENNTNVDDLKNSVYLGQPSKAKKLRYDDYERKPLPELRQSPKQPERSERKVIPESVERSVERYKRQLFEKSEELSAKTATVMQKENELEKLKAEIEKLKEYNLFLINSRDTVDRQYGELKNEVSVANSLNKQLNEENVNLRLEIDQINAYAEDLKYQNLQAQLDLNRQEYKVKIQELNREYDRFELIETPIFTIKYYSQIYSKLQEYEHYINRAPISELEEMKLILTKLFNDLTRNFERNASKHSSHKIIDFLSSNYRLRLKCLQQLQSIDEHAIRTGTSP